MTMLGHHLPASEAPLYHRSTSVSLAGRRWFALSGIRILSFPSSTRRKKRCQCCTRSDKILWIHAGLSLCELEIALDGP